MKAGLLEFDCSNCYNINNKTIRIEIMTLGNCLFDVRKFHWLGYYMG